MFVLIITAILCAPLTYWAMTGKAEMLIARHAQAEHRK